MGSLKSVDIRYLAPSELEAEVEKLRDPWIAAEGPTKADFRQWPGGPPDRALHPRGLAFDENTTVTWDEDTVQVIRPTAETDEDVVVRRGEVLVRERFPGLKSVYRVDYLHRGVLVASCYLPGRTTAGKGDSDDA